MLNASNLHPYQQKAISFIEDKKKCALFMEMGLGKEQPLTAKISTPTGWTVLSDLRIGDELSTEKGGVSRVTGIYPQGKKEIYRVYFEDGTTVECGLDHLWPVSAYNCKDAVLSVSDILKRGVLKPNGNSRFRVKLPEPIFYAKNDLEIDPYFLGALIGDGCLCQSVVTLSNPNMDRDIIKHIIPPEGILMKKDEYASCPRFVFISSVKQYNPLMRAIKKLRLNVKSGDKFIPWHYLTSSIEDRIALLQGLMDTDGSCIKNRSVFHTTSKNLAHDFADLVRGLGGYCSINMYDRGVKGIEYQIPIRFKNLCPFRSERKKANWKPVQKGTDYKSIVDIVKTGEFVEQACISVDNPTHLYITDGYNVTHNTASTLTALQSLKDQGKIKRTLIIAPLRVANSVWAQEIEKWEHISLRPVICTGGEEKRVRALTSAGDLFIINRENVKWLVDLAKKKKKWPFDCVVIDESSSFKSPSSRRFKALKLALPKINYMVLLTGTPAPNSLMDIWSQIFLIDQGERLGKTMGNFKNRYFHQTGYGGYTYQLTHGADNEIHDKISDVCLTMKAEDYLDMPERIDINTVCPMPAKARAEYNKLESEFFIQLETGEIEVSTSAVMANKLLQFCNGAVYDNEKEYHVTHDSKIEALKEIVEDNPNENILVAYNFKSDLERLKEAFPDAVVLDRKGACIPKWNDGEIKMLLAHPASAGHGLNLQHGGSLIVWFGLNWSLELYQQFNARLYRQGQSQSVRIVHLVSNGGMDSRVQMALAGKAETQEELLQYLKDNR